MSETRTMAARMRMLLPLIEGHELPEVALSLYTTGVVHGLALSARSVCAWAEALERPVRLYRLGSGELVIETTATVGDVPIVVWHMWDCPGQAPALGVYPAALVKEAL